MIKSLPFLVFPVKTAVRLARPLYGFGKSLSALFPGLGMDLKQSDMGLREHVYLSLAFLASASAALVSVLLFFLVAFFSSQSPVFARASLVFYVSSAALPFLVFFYYLKYPALLAFRRMKRLNRHLLFGLRHMLVNIKSGVPLFSSLVSVAKGNYGELSREFGRIVEAINGGMGEREALEEAALRNPSGFFRRAVWQIANTSVTGVDMADVLEHLVDNLSEEQRISVKKYGSELNPLAVVYLVFSVIFPPLGVTVLMILGNMLGFALDRPVFLLIIFVVVSFNVLYLGMLRDRRPVLVV